MAHRFWAVLFLLVLLAIYTSHATHFAGWVFERLRHLRSFIGIYLSRFSGFDLYGETGKTRRWNAFKRLTLLSLSFGVTVIAIFLSIVLLVVSLGGGRIEHPDTLLFAVTALVVSLRFAIYCSGDPLERLAPWMITCVFSVLMLTEFATLIRHMAHVAGADMSATHAGTSLFGFAPEDIAASFPDSSANMLGCLALAVFAELALHGKAHGEERLMENASLGAVCLARSRCSVPLLGRKCILEKAQHMVQTARTSISWLTSTNDPVVVEAIAQRLHASDIKVRLVTNTKAKLLPTPALQFVARLTINDGFLIVDDERVLRTCSRLNDSSGNPPHLGFYGSSLAEVTACQRSFAQAVAASVKLDRRRKVSPP